MKKIILLLVVVLNICAFAVAPPKPDASTEQLKKYNNIKEFQENNKVSINYSSPSRGSSLKKAPVPKFNWIGNANIIIIPVEFSDVKFTETNAELKAKIQNSVFNTLNNNSMAAFFNGSSYGQFNINNTIITDKVTSAQTMSHYGVGDSGNTIRNLPKEALTLAYANDPLFTNICDNPNANGIDLNADGDIHGVEACDKYGATIGLTEIDNTFLIIYHAGGAEENTSVSTDIWSHQWTLDDSFTGHTVGSSTFYAYSTFAEFNTEDGTPVSIACHEFAHQLGGSDFYGAGTIGRWSLMSEGVWQGYYVNPGTDYSTWIGVDFDAYHKYMFGWLTPVDMNNMAVDTHSITLNPLSDLSDTTPGTLTNILYKYTLNTDGTEYYLFSVRADLDYDSNLNNLSNKHGLMILHMDENVKLSGETIYLNNEISSHTNSLHPACWLVRADNSNSSTYDVNDLYPNSSGNNMFTPTSTPDSYGYGETKAPVITDIVRQANNKISFNFINTKTFISSFALNPMDNKLIHMFVKVNFDITGSLKGIIGTNEVTFSKIGSTTLYSTNYNFANSVTGNFTLNLSATDNSNAIISSQNATLSVDNNYVTNFSIIKEQKNINNFNLSASKNIIAYKNFEEGENDFVFSKGINLISGNANVNLFAENLQNKENLYVYENNSWNVLTNYNKNINGEMKFSIFKDVEKPQINSVSNSELLILDKYSGVNSITIKDSNGKEYSYYKNGNRVILKTIPETSYIVEVTDVAGNKSNKTINKAPGTIFTSVNTYPNPSSIFTTIKYNLNTPDSISLKIFNTNGKLIYKANNPAGFNDFVWMLDDVRGNKVSNGIYFYVLNTGNIENKGKIAVIK